MATTFERTKEIFKSLTANDVSEETTLESLHLDSLDLVELITELEDEFGVMIPDEVAENFKSVGEMVVYVDTFLKNKE